jgi:hypothetical protein
MAEEGVFVVGLFPAQLCADKKRQVHQALPFLQ